MFEAPGELLDALWDTAEEYGVRLQRATQIEIGRRLAGLTRTGITARAVDEACVAAGLRKPPAGFGRAVRARWLSSSTEPSFLDVLLEFRQFAIGSLSREFGGRTRGREEELRNYLHTYLPRHGFKEAQCGKGNSDIVIPDLHGGVRPSAIIEVKVWTDQSTYEEGLEELGRYIHTERPSEAFMVVFGDRVPLPPIITDQTQAVVGPKLLSGQWVPVVVVPFEVDYPSKARAADKRRAKSGPR